MSEILIKKKNVVLDATLFNSLIGCARLLDLRHHHNFIPIGGKGNALEAGSIVHKILEVFHQSLIDGCSRSKAIEQGMIAGEQYWRYGEPFFKSNYTDALADPCQSVPIENVKDKQGKIKYIGYNHIIDTMEQYFDYYKSDSWTPIESERVKGEVIYEDDEIRVMWKAKIDVVWDTIQGVFNGDHKSMKMNRATITNLNPQFMGQCILQKTRMMCKNKIGFQTSLKPNEKFTREIVSFTADRLMEFIDTVAYRAKEYVGMSENNYYPPNYTHCDKFAGCIFIPVCEANRDMREEELRQHFKLGTPWDIDNED